MTITMCGVVNEVTEDYCNLKVSELLKQAGFKEKCGARYVKKDDGEWVFEETRFALDWNVSNDYITCPTQQRAKKWVREKYKLHVDVSWDLDLDWFFQVISLTETVQFDYLEPKIYHSKNETGFGSESFASDVALEFVLKKWAVTDSEKRDEYE